MSIRAFLVASAAVLAAVPTAYADTITGSYTAINAGSSSAYLPTINDDGGAFLPGQFSETLGVGSTTTPSTFLQVAPAGGGSGTVSGGIQLAMTLSEGGSAVTGVTTSAGGNTAFTSGGVLYFEANYDIFYGSQTDCITWDAASCTSNNNTTTIGETLKVSFADGALLDINLYNWSDWNMQPDISFDLVSGAGTPVPEPGSVAVFAVALAGLLMIKRRYA